MPTRPLALPAPSTVDNEERAFLTEVAVSAMLELQDKRQQEEERRVGLARIAVDTMREMFAELPPPQSIAVGTRFIAQRRVCACNASPCLTE